MSSTQYTNNFSLFLWAAVQLVGVQYIVSMYYKLSFKIWGVDGGGPDRPCPRVLTLIVHRKFIGSQQILVNILK